MGLAHHDPVEAFRAQARDGGWPLVCDPTLGFERPELALFIAIWREKAGQRPMASRTDLSPRDLKQNLRKVMLVERHEGQRYRVRLIGTALTPIWGDLTGKFVDEAVPTHLQPRWTSHFDLVLEARRPMRFLVRVDFADKDFLVAEMASVPLADERGRPAFVMSAIHASAKPWDDSASGL